MFVQWFFFHYSFPGFIHSRNGRPIFGIRKYSRRDDEIFKEIKSANWRLRIIYWRLSEEQNQHNLRCVFFQAQRFGMLFRFQPKISDAGILIVSSCQGGQIQWILWKWEKTDANSITVHCCCILRYERKKKNHFWVNLSPFCWNSAQLPDEQQLIRLDRTQKKRRQQQQPLPHHWIDVDCLMCPNSRPAATVNWRTVPHDRVPKVLTLVDYVLTSEYLQKWELLLFTFDSSTVSRVQKKFERGIPRLIQIIITESHWLCFTEASFSSLPWIWIILIRCETE